MEEPEKKIAAHGVRCFAKIKMFLMALTWAYVSKSLSGTYMVSMLTQIERQFDIPTSIVGLISGSFGIGNLLLILFVSYFGMKLHRPIIIGVGCAIMGLGCFLISLPHFLMGTLCVLSLSVWILLYLWAFLLGEMNDDLTITPTDTRWVGAWWIGFLVCAGVNILASILFLLYKKKNKTTKKTLPKEGLQDNGDGTENVKEEKHREKAKEENRGITKDFFPFMKSLSCNPIYMLFILISVLQINTFTSTFNFLSKYLEQQFGKSTAEVVFFIGLYTLPTICIGYLIAGFIMKKFNITVKKAAYLALCLSLCAYLFGFCGFLITCDNVPVSGLTISYKGGQHPLYVENNVLADCNTRCSCLTNTWDPVCGDNGLSYMSACHAGCEKSVGTGMNMISRCMKSEEKSLGVGIHTFCIRVFGGIPAPVYIGALLDRTCLHWGTQKCGEPGACRMYDINSFRSIYLGLPAALRGISYLPAFIIVILIRKFCIPGEIDSSEMEIAEMKLTEMESECTDTHRSHKFKSDGELKTKL
ncbi:LOW QUALITY PROTEIN: solute carrier organic anion transporter family member 1A4-like [Mus caroli]|uniref:Solute carrier organic anion transporter family member n=1 Tax=Mus caroli TaxID=10089 RepID=A0A6P5P156_MUSCR|nr:LOW QUALITY PROTEIN: solute carrier organic anion transporter family member 1A4-like [Mus caroli]